MTSSQGISRRTFNTVCGALAAGLATSLAPLRIAHAQPQKLKVGVILPRSGTQGLTGQSCQKGADLAPGVLKEMLGLDLDLMTRSASTRRARPRSASIAPSAIGGRLPTRLSTPWQRRCARLDFRGPGCPRFEPPSLCSPGRNTRPGGLR